MSAWSHRELRRAAALQRKGLTLTEISEAIGQPRDEVVLFLYGGVRPQMAAAEANGSGRRVKNETEESGGNGANDDTAPEGSAADEIPSTIPESGGGAVSAVKAQGRLENAAGVEPPSPVPSASGYYRLRRADGSWLHQSGLTTTVDRKWAWRGTAQQLENVRKRFFALTRDMKPEAAE